MAEGEEKLILIEKIKQKIEELLGSDAFTEEEKLSLVKEAKALLISETAEVRS